MNRATKGRAVRTIAKKILLHKGYVVYLFPHTRYGPNDCFGTDLVAMNEDTIRFIQTTADTGVARKADELQKYPWPSHVDVEIWRYIGGRRHKVPGDKKSVNQYFYIYNRRGEKIHQIDLIPLKKEGVI